MERPTERQIERAVAALLPFVHEWNLPLNPEHLREIAAAVLEHFDRDSTYESIDAAVREQIADFARMRASLYQEGE